MDRVRLWNSLVFSDGYFSLLSNSSKYERKDLSRFFRENIALKVRRDEEAERKKKVEELQQGKKDRRNGFSFGDVTLTAEEKRVIRDRHYTPKVMLKMWNMIKQRQYEVETTRQGSADHPKGGSESKKRDLDASGEE